MSMLGPRLCPLCDEPVLFHPRPDCFLQWPRYEKELPVNIEAILNDLEDAERAWKEAGKVLVEASDRRTALIGEAVEAGVRQSVLARLLGVSRQRIHQLTEV